VYLIPFGGECTPIIGYKGMKQLIRNTGEVKFMGGSCFTQEELESGMVRIKRHPPGVEHDWSPVEYDEKNVYGAYFEVEMKDGSHYVATVTRGEIEKRRDRSKGKKNGPWKTDFAPMAIKCAVRKLFGVQDVPISVDKMTPIAEAMEADGDSGNRAVNLTRSQRSAMSFRAAVAPSDEPEAIEAQAETVDEPVDEPTAQPAGGPYAAEWDALVEQYAASETQATRALKTAGLHAPPTDPDQLHDAHVALEREVGA
jgi:recombinational DNA repair protein RecT